MTSPHLQTISQPSIIDVGDAVDALSDLRAADPTTPECFLLIEATDQSGAFMQAIAVNGVPRWNIEVCNSEEAALRALREPVTRGRAVELLGRFVQGDRSLGNGREWLDVDFEPRLIRTPMGVAAIILLLLACSTMLWFYTRVA